MTHPLGKLGAKGVSILTTQPVLEQDPGARGVEHEE